MEEKEIIQKIRKGDPETIRLLYDKYFNSTAKYIISNKGTLDDAKDTFQDAILVLLKKCEDEKFELTSSIHTYLFAVVKNIWLKNLRKNSTTNSDLIDNLELIIEDGLESEIEWREKEKLYFKKFKLLGDTCQQILKLFLENQSMETIAKKLKLNSAAYAKKKKYKCKLKLIQLIKNDINYKRIVG